MSLPLARCKAPETTCFAAVPGGASCPVRPPALNRPGSRQRSDFLIGSTSFSKGRFSTTPLTPRRRSVLHGPRRLRLTAALKIDDAVVMCGLEDRSGRVDALEDRDQSPPHRLGAEPRDHLCGAGNIGQIAALDRLTPGLTRPRMRVAGFGEVGFRLCLGHRLGPRLKPVRHRSVLWGCNATRGLIRHQPPPGYVLRLSDFPLRTKEVPVFTPIRVESDTRAAQKPPPCRFGG